MAKSQTGRPYIYGIDAVRFACAFMVTLFHLGFASWASPLYLRPYKMPSIENIAQPGWVGVELFFVISGLVIINSAASANAMSFLKGRILRLYPAVWICASLTLVVIATQDVNRRIIKSYLRSVTLYPVGPWIDGQYWTLACEISFYALVFIMCVTGQKMRMPGLALGLSLASTVFIALLCVFPDSANLAIFTESAWRALPLYYGCQFAIGIYVYLWLLSDARMSLISWAGLVCALAAGAAQIYMGAANTSDRTLAAAGHAFSPHAAISIWVAGLIVIAASVRYGRQISRLPAALLQTIKTLGSMTYPLYLLHFTIGIQLLDWLTDLGMTPLMALGLAIAIVCAMSLAVCKWGEPPIRSVLRLVFDRLGQRVAGFQTKESRV
ncbi:acyltransferase family protein [Rhizobium leguminosarum]|uniref:acyltransferase family protein n=1 Tax=Rhizobium leguminosarum TaxID=384 RepID=UPI0014424FEB|nr:acyltransferase [Rhizobium leguminosarum]NKL08889.1 acyltransferase family protein [Rhizobium leguminosarum bv. viciae]NKL84313.1 acyltransferase family protein [Rhizobium leguminosarum bv. viciae]NKL93144.1 acyltransferase family protein [Rhizobium leguminosarum bv. viciae]NKM94846.1 acyltransferase family protein [Rhizobium leguminosarum bv. viciae]